MNKIPTDIIYIEAGNDVVLCFPIVFRRFENGKAIDEIPDRLDFIHSVVITHNGVAQSYDFTTDGNKVVVPIPATLEAGSYDVHISGNNNGEISTVRKSSFCIVPFSYMANSSDYVQGSPILMPDSVFIATGSNASGMKTLVINVPVEDLARIINSHKTDGMPDEYLVNADLGFGINEINAFMEGKLNVQLMTNLKGVLSDDDFILTMTLDNVSVYEIPKERNILLNGERVIYAITLIYINDGAIRCEFSLSENYCTAVVNEAGIPDYSNDIEQAKQMAINAQQTADEALQATQEITDPTNGSQTTISDALTNVYSATQVTDPTSGNYPMPISDALTNVYSATQVTDPTNGSYPTPIGDALTNVYNNLNDKIMQDDDGSAFALLLMSQIIRDFTADISLIGNGRCISISSERHNDILGVEINDALFNEMYLKFKSGENIEAGDMFSNYIYENTSRKVTLKFGGKTLPTFKMTNVAYPDYNLDIIIDDIHVREMIGVQLGVSNVVALRMLEAPLTVGDNNDSCYWALVSEDGTVHNPGTY